MGVTDRFPARERNWVSGQDMAGGHSDVHSEGGSALEIFEAVGEVVVAKLQEDVRRGHSWGAGGGRMRMSIAVETRLPFHEQGHLDREVYDEGTATIEEAHVVEESCHVGACHDQ